MVYPTLSSLVDKFEGEYGEDLEQFSQDHQGIYLLWYQLSAEEEPQTQTRTRRGGSLQLTESAAEDRTGISEDPRVILLEQSLLFIGRGEGHHEGQVIDLADYGPAVSHLQATLSIRYDGICTLIPANSIFF